MRLLGLLAIVLIVLIAGAAAYAYFGFYNVAASNPHTDIVRWSLETVQDNSVERNAREQVGQSPPLNDPEMIRTGGRHYQQEGCLGCHGGPGMTQAEFAENMRPEPPDLTRAAASWNDTELFWIIQHGIKMTGMPAFGPSHSDNELWAMVAFLRQLPGMSEAQYRELTAAAEGKDDHHAGEGSQDQQNEGAPSHDPQPPDERDRTHGG